MLSMHGHPERSSFTEHDDMQKNGSEAATIRNKMRKMPAVSVGFMIKV